MMLWNYKKILNTQYTKYTQYTQYQISISNAQYKIYTKYTQYTNIISNSAPPQTHHRQCFNLFILHHNLLDNQKGRDINKNIFLRLDILPFAKTFYVCIIMYICILHLYIIYVCQINIGGILNCNIIYLELLFKCNYIYLSGSILNL